MRTGHANVRDIFAEGCRLTAGVYLSEDQQAMHALLRVRSSTPLGELTRGRRVFRGPIFKRMFAADSAHGRPYVSAKDIVQADIRPAGYLSERHGALLDELTLHEGMILITCSGMNLGRAVWTRADMEGLCASHDLIRIEPDPEKIPPGYLYAFLASRYGRVAIRRQIFGGNIKHVEPEHVTRIAIPRIQAGAEIKAHERVEQMAGLLARYCRDIRAATGRFFAAVNLEDISADDWHAMGRDLGFTAPFPCVDSMRALNFNPRYMRLQRSIQGGQWAPLAKVCEAGSLRRGDRFKRVDADPKHAYEILGQKELFALFPEGRWIARSAVGEDVLVDAGTALVAAQGTFGESELYCRAEFIWGDAVLRGYSEHLLRVVADEAVMPRGCLFAFLRSETAFRMLRSISTGTKLQDHHHVFRGHLPVPIPEPGVQREIHDMVTGAYEARERATRLHAEALALVEKAIEEGG